MPGTPTEDQQSVDTLIGPVTFYSFIVEQSTTAYSVAYTDYPEDLVQTSSAESLLAGGRDGAVANVNATLLDEHSISLKGHPGIEFEAQAMAGQSPRQVFFSARFYLVDQRLYQMIVVTQDRIASSADTQKFLNSFTLLNE